MTPPVLQTERLTLGPATMAHYEAFADFVATGHSRFLGGPGDRSDAWESVAHHAGQWTLRGYGTFWVTETTTGTPVGRVGLWHPAWLPEPELSWAIYAAHTRKGLAVEAARAARDWAREARGLDGLWSLIRDGNEASLATARALGAVREGTHDYGTGSVAQVWRHPRAAGGAAVPAPDATARPAARPARRTAAKGPRRASGKGTPKAPARLPRSTEP